MIAENIENIKQNIIEILEKQNRSWNDITLLAVTKTHPEKKIEEALLNGIECIGENKVQEAERKIPNLSVPYREFHFIGHLQSNKINKLMPLRPTLIHTIDKLSTATKLNRYCEKHGRKQAILIQVNTSEESSKSGIKPEETETLIEKIRVLPHIQIKGLMTIGKLTTDKEEIRACFRLLKKLFDQIQRKNLSQVQMQYLSMGMTSDYQIALEEGSNLIRIGSAIFGSRTYH